MQNLWNRILKNSLNKTLHMPLEHSKCSGYWNFCCNSSEAIGPNIVLEVINSVSTQLKYDKCDLMKVEGIHFKSA